MQLVFVSERYLYLLEQGLLSFALVHCRTLWYNIYMIKETDLAYAAGVIDSDGCITISHERRNDRDKPNLYHRLNIRVITTDYRILEWFKSTFDGSTYVQNKPRGNRKTCWAWQKRDAPAAEFIKGILPYLIYKKDQGIVALEFREYKDKRKQQRFVSDSVRNEKEFADKLKSLHQHRRAMP